MIVDSSAIIAILSSESDAHAFLHAIRSAPVRRLSAASYVEVALVIDGRRDPVLSSALDSLISRTKIEVVPLTAQHARIAREAHQRFGRGSGHPARLNLGDTFSYALARDLGEPLLFKGGDFALTDIELVIEPIRRRRLSEVVAGYVAEGA